MQKILKATLTVLTITISTTVSAADKSATALLGFSQSAITIGANFESRSNSQFGLGGFFLHSSEKKENASKNQVMGLGAMAVGHILENSNLDLYLAPGFGIMMVKGLSGADDQTTFGPIWKIGFLFKATANVSVGLEQTQLVNWFTDKVAAQVTYTNAAVNFSF